MGDAGRFDRVLRGMADWRDGACSVVFVGGGADGGLGDLPAFIAAARGVSWTPNTMGRGEHCIGVSCAGPVHSIWSISGYPFGPSYNTQR